jgi:uncharacterized protein (TIGR00730 family)
MKTYKFIVEGSRPDKNKFNVSIFGSARIKDDKPIYNQVYNLAKELAIRDISVITGGGPGLMQAANTGHRVGNKNGKSKSVGLGIKLPKEQGYNPGVDDTETFMRFTSRLDKFMLLSNAVVVASGGIGTILELFYTWQLVQVKHVCSIPIILMGDMWPGLIKWLKKQPLRKGYFTREDYDLLYYAKDYQEALKIIDNYYKDFKSGNRKRCVNWDVYNGRMKTK